MRLWHYAILPYLPQSQILAQKRECDLIWRDIRNGKQTNHILINYIWEYDMADFDIYYYLLKREFERRGFKFVDNSLPKFRVVRRDRMPFARHHNDEYLAICRFNMLEKYIRGQKDFTDEVWQRLDEFYKEKTNVTN